MAMSHVEQYSPPLGVLKLARSNLYFLAGSIPNKDNNSSSLQFPNMSLLSEEIKMKQSMPVSLLVTINLTSGLQLAPDHKWLHKQTSLFIKNFFLF